MMLELAAIQLISRALDSRLRLRNSEMLRCLLFFSINFVIKLTQHPYA